MLSQYIQWKVIAWLKEKIGQNFILSMFQEEHGPDKEKIRQNFILSMLQEEHGPDQELKPELLALFDVNPKKADVNPNKALSTALSMDAHKDEISVLKMILRHPKLELNRDETHRLLLTCMYKKRSIDIFNCLLSDPRIHHAFSKFSEKQIKDLWAVASKYMDGAAQETMVCRILMHLFKNKSDLTFENIDELLPTFSMLKEARFYFQISRQAGTLLDLAIKQREVEAVRFLVEKFGIQEQHHVPLLALAIKTDDVEFYQFVIAYIKPAEAQPLGILNLLTKQFAAYPKMYTRCPKIAAYYDDALKEVKAFKIDQNESCETVVDVSTTQEFPQSQTWSTEDEEMPYQVARELIKASASSDLSEWKMPPSGEALLQLKKADELSPAEQVLGDPGRRFLTIMGQLSKDSQIKVCGIAYPNDGFKALFPDEAAEAALKNFAKKLQA